jgi:hypothetical protein
VAVSKRNAAFKFTVTPNLFGENTCSTKRPLRNISTLAGRLIVLLLCAVPDVENCNGIVLDTVNHKVW